MRALTVLVVSVVMLALAAPAGSTRFVIDDDEYDDKVAEAAGKLLHAGKLIASDILRKQVRPKTFALSPVSQARQGLAAPDLCERLRESTLAVGAFYKCPDCGEWHFNSSAGFVVATNGIVSTCCHVVLARDEGVKEAYLIAADSDAHVFPVKSVLAADPDSDTCLLKIDAPPLKPLALRPGVRTGERVYCLSHPGGYHFMFTQGMVARLNRRPNDVYDEDGKTNGLQTRPILFLNVTAEFAPGSSGAAIVDEAGNAVGQVASIADAGEPRREDDNEPPSPSVPIRFCTATEEILKLTDLSIVHSPRSPAHSPKAAAQHPPKPKSPAPKPVPGS